MNNSTSTPIATASSDSSTSSSSNGQKSSMPQSNSSTSSTPVGQTSIAGDARTTGRSNSIPESVGGDHPIGTKDKEIVKENKDVTAR